MSFESSMAIVGVASTVSTVAFLSIFGTTNFQNILSSLNQLQLYLMLPLTKAYIHSHVINFINGVKFSLLKIDYSKLDGYMSYFQTPLSNEYLNMLNLNYMSAFRNLFSTIVTVVAIVPIHLIILMPFIYF